MGDLAPTTFYIGHHDADRQQIVSEEVFHHAEDLGYDTLTTRITNANFQPRVLFQLSEYMRQHEANASSNATAAPSLQLSPLTSDDSDLAPSDLSPRLLHLASPWIDLASMDPAIATISRQVLEHEVLYAAFCGATNVLIHGPSPIATDAGLAHYARAIKKALELSPGIHFQLLLPMSYSPDSLQGPVDFADLSRFARQSFVSNSAPAISADALGSWDVWHRIRSFCKYDMRLSIGQPPSMLALSFDLLTLRPLALTIPLHLPSAECQNRWHSEPIRIMHFPRSSFTPNKFSVDVLSKSHQTLISRFLRLKTMPWFLLSDIGPLPDDNPYTDDEQTEAGTYTSGTPPRSGGLSPLSMNPTPAEAARQKSHAVHPSQKPLAHLEYFRHHLQPRQPSLSALELYGAGYQDFPQSPLQPLTDNLESVTYEVFEKDPIKYEWYERAIAAALTDWRRLQKPRSRGDRIVIAVVGAGRGPLVHRALIAAEKARVEVDVWAVEKNPSAFVHLHRRVRDEWGDKVRLVQSDMRGWKGPLYPTADSTVNGTVPASDTQSAKVDILVSELLGSFADNELSPECLDGVQHHLAPEHGISIPQSYNAHLTPLSAPRLWYDISVRGKLQSGIDATSIPYVAWLHAIDYLSTTLRATPTPSTNGSASPVHIDGASTGKQPDSTAEPIVKEAWSFSHPVAASTIPPSNNHNTRFVQLSFPTPHRGNLHGLGGYFETVLYASPDADNTSSTGPIELSTHPLTMQTKSPDMISWFPIFFPIKEPLSVVEGGEVNVSMWRQTDGRKVWYEWLVESFAVLGERRVSIGSSSLVSSEKEGCMM